MKNNKGFTLLEMLIVIVLMSMVMWGFSSLLVAGTRQMAALKKQQEKMVLPSVTYYVAPGEARPGGTTLVACFGESVVKACSVKHPCDDSCVNGSLYKKTN